MLIILPALLSLIIYLIIVNIFIYLTIYFLCSNYTELTIFIMYLYESLLIILVFAIINLTFLFVMKVTVIYSITKFSVLGELKFIISTDFVNKFIIFDCFTTLLIISIPKSFLIFQSITKTKQSFYYFILRDYLLFTNSFSIEV